MKTKKEILTNKSLTQIDNFFENNNYLSEQFRNKFLRQIQNDVKYIKDCSESSIVSFYILSFNELINDTHDNYSTKNFLESVISKARHKLVRKYVPNKTFDNNIDIYFNDVKREYILHPMNESENLIFVPENKDIFIKNNLKLVINCAKRYQNLGLPLDDLIQTGNLGLLIAFEKFDTTRANLRVNIQNDILDNPNETFTYDESVAIVTKHFKYPKILAETIKKIPENGFESKDDFIDWSNENIRSASFSSVGFARIRAEIVAALNKLVNTVHVPKSAQNKGVKPANMIRLDSINPHTDDNYTDNTLYDIYNDEFAVEDNNLATIENNNLYKELVNDVLIKLSPIERRVIKKRFGIEYPFEMSIQEIADSEGISISNTKSAINSAMKTIANSITGEDRKILLELLS